MAQFTLQTSRLLLREFNLQDHMFIIALVNSKGWIKYIGDRNIHSHLEAKAYLHKGPIRSYHENGFGLYMVLLKDSHTPIGMCGLIKRAYLEHPDIGFAFLPEFTAQGYGFEAATAVLNFAKNDLKIKTVLAITIHDNKASIQLIKKLGMSFIKSFYAPGDEEELNLYSSH